MSVFAGVLSGPAFIPVLKPLARVGVCADGALAAEPSVACASPEHVAWLAAAAVAAVLLIALTLRLAHVDFKLTGLEVRRSVERVCSDVSFTCVSFQVLVLVVFLVVGVSGVAWCL